MNICESNNLHKAIGTLQKYCAYTFIYRCQNSNIGGEVYILAYGYIKPFTDNYKGDWLYPDIQTYAKVEKYREIIYTTFREFLSAKHRSIVWNERTSVHNKKWALLPLESSGLSKTINRVGIPLIREDSTI